MKLLAIKIEIDGKSVEITRWADLLMVISSGRTVGFQYRGPTRTALRVFKSLDYNPQIEELDIMECLVAEVWSDQSISGE